MWPAWVYNFPISLPSIWSRKIVFEEPYVRMLSDRSLKSIKIFNLVNWQGPINFFCFIFNFIFWPFRWNRIKTIERSFENHRYHPTYEPTLIIQILIIAGRLPRRFIIKVDPMRMCDSWPIIWFTPVLLSKWKSSLKWTVMSESGRSTVEWKWTVRGD